MTVPSTVSAGDMPRISRTVGHACDNFAIGVAADTKAMRCYTRVPAGMTALFGTMMMPLRM